MTRELKVAKYWHKKSQKENPTPVVKTVCHTGGKQQLRNCIVK